MDKEFINPLAIKDYLSIQHIERYRFAYNLIKNVVEGNKDNIKIKILDIACGQGYGSYILSNLGFVVGADYDYDAVLCTKKCMNVKNVVQADALSLPFKDESFDFVVSFETIEHVYEGEVFIQEMKRVLKKGGIFICSTPNIRYTAHPPFHLKEYTPYEFYELMGRHFMKVEKYAQYFTLKDRINDIVNWHIRGGIVKILDFLKIKNTVKKLFKKYYSKNKHDGEYYSEKDILNKLINSGINDEYKVKSYNGNKLLRIMVAVCYK